MSDNKDVPICTYTDGCCTASLYKMVIKNNDTEETLFAIKSFNSDEVKNDN